MNLSDYIYPFDLNGNKASNYITKELHVTTEINGEDFNVIVPKVGPFHVHDLKLRHVASNRILTPHVDYGLLAPYRKLADDFDRATFGMIAIHDKRLTGNWEISYRTLGGEYSLDHDEVLQDLVDYAYNPRLINYDDIAPETIPKEFPLRPHELDVEDDVYYTADVIFALSQIANAVSGDLKPFHRHEIADTNQLTEELENRVNKYGNFKIGLCAPYFLVNHHGTVALELPLDMVGMRVDIEVVFASAAGKGVVSVGGVVTASGNWTDTYAVSEGTCPAQTAACGLNSNGHPYIWIGDDSTNWVNTNALLSSVLINATDPKRYTNGWKFGTVELPEESVRSFPIQAGGLAGVGLVPTSRRINNHPLTEDVNLNALDVHAVPANAKGEVVEAIVFADGSRGTIKAKRTTPDGQDVYLVLLLDDMIEYGSANKQTIINGMAEERPSVRTKDGLKRILIEGDDVGGGPGSASYVPETRKVNGHELSDDISLTAEDVNALFLNDDGALDEDLLLAQGRKYMLMVNGSPKPVTQITTLDTVVTTLLGTTGAQTVLQGNRANLPSVLIEGTLYPIKLEGYGAADGITLVKEEFIHACTTAEGNSVPIIGIKDSTTYGSLVTILGNSAVKTILETKDEVVINNGTVKANPLLRNSDKVLVDKTGRGTDLLLSEEKGVKVKRGSSEVPVITATKAGVEIGDSEEQIHLASRARPTMLVEGKIVDIACLTDITNAGDGGETTDASFINATVPVTPLTTEGVTTRPTIMIKEGDGLIPIWFTPTKAIVNGSNHVLQQLDAGGQVLPPSSDDGVYATTDPITLNRTSGLFTIKIDAASMPEGVSLTKAIFELEDSTGANPTVFIQGTVSAPANNVVTLTGNFTSCLSWFNFTNLNAIVSPTIGIRVGQASSGPQFLPLVGGEVNATAINKDVRWTVGINGQTGELMFMSTVDGATTITSVGLDAVIKTKDFSMGDETVINRSIEALEKRLAILEKGKGNDDSE